MENLMQIINSNPSIFDLTFKDYVNGKIIFSEPSERAIAKAKKDLSIFEECQQAIYKREKISEGDWVQLKDGSFSRVTVASWSDSIQIGGYFGSSVYIHTSGNGSYSGGCDESIKRSELIDTGEFKDASCWHFHEGSSGANRGVSFTLKFKVWKQI